MTVATATTVLLGVAVYKALAIENMLTGKTGVIMRAEAIEQKTYITLDNLDKYTRAWSDASKSQLSAVQGIAGNVNKFLVDTSRVVTTIGDNVNPAVGQLRVDLADLDATIKASTSLEETATTAVASLKAPITAANESFTDLNAILQDPDITEAFTNANLTTKNLAGITGDVKDETDKIVHPPACKGKLCGLKHVWTALSASQKLGQIFFYWSNSNL